ncbi:hypothetical protein CI1B_27220 [Bradyrhizobium ivorense]|uniref:Transcription factor zinc-finger domain-containing protein n=1 Tax=Bradyrhizobium ivorense TaxID=2511166 RepID=A0A508T617_9BRAD|nr:hypothetical protein CI1B_27220 [Bradyrhizobium ivorense]
MDLTRCPRCGKPLKAVMALDQRTDLRCISCDGMGEENDTPAWVESPPTGSLPNKPLERTRSK